MKTLTPKLKTKFLNLKDCNVKIITNDSENISRIDPYLITLLHDNVEIIEDESVPYTELVIQSKDFERRIYFPNTTSASENGDIHLVIKLIEGDYLLVFNRNEILYVSEDKILDYINRMVPEGIGRVFTFKFFDKYIKLKFSSRDFTYSNSFSYSYKLYVNNRFHGYVRVPFYKIDKTFLVSEIDKQISFGEYLLKYKDLALSGNKIRLYEELKPISLRELDPNLYKTVKTVVRYNFTNPNALNDLVFATIRVLENELKLDYLAQIHVSSSLRLDYKCAPTVINLTREDIKWILDSNKSHKNFPDTDYINVNWLVQKIINLKNLREGLLWE